MPIYRTSGTLTGTIEPENVQLAQEYLVSDDMTPILKEHHGLPDTVERIQWYLNADGHTWYVEVIARRRLTKAQLKDLAESVSGQNSDGLGESFEQQAFAELEGDCGVCDACVDGYACDGDGYAGMISFDWKTNKCEFELVS